MIGLSLIVTTFERPLNLRRALQSVAAQENVGCDIEVIVADDGSTDETHEIIRQFAESVDFPVRMTTHPHDGFQVGRCRNEGARMAMADYLLFLDGDCLLPADHLEIQLRRRRQGVVLAGDCARLDEEPSARIDEQVVRSGEYRQWAPRSEIKRLRSQHRKAWLYNLLKHPRKPKLVGNNFSLWKQDYERVNGFDERFVGWGCEDDDLGIRLKKSGVKIESILNDTCTYHMWHPVESTFTEVWKDGVNIDYHTRHVRLSRCRHGMRVLAPHQLGIRFANTDRSPESLSRLLPGPFQCDTSRAAINEVEILVLPGNGSFSPDTECRILMVTEPTTVKPASLHPDYVVGPPEIRAGRIPCYPLDCFSGLLQELAGMNAASKAA